MGTAAHECELSCFSEYQGDNIAYENVCAQLGAKLGIRVWQTICMFMCVYICAHLPSNPQVHVILLIFICLGLQVYMDVFVAMYIDVELYD